MARPKRNPAEQVMRSFMSLAVEEQDKVLFAIDALREVRMAELAIDGAFVSAPKRVRRRMKAVQSTPTE